MKRSRCSRKLVSFTDEIIDELNILYAFRKLLASGFKVSDVAAN